MSESEPGRLGLFLPLPLTRHSYKNARLHSISAQLGKSLRLAGNIATPTATIAVENREHGLGNYALLRQWITTRTGDFDSQMSSEPLFNSVTGH